MPTYSTPGAYIREISKLPASVAPVATAVPAFIGYTAKNDGSNEPSAVRISSMLEFIETFGGPFSESFTVQLTDQDITSSGSPSSFLLYYQLEMYFANGGGPCYIVSVNTFDNSSGIDKTELDKGIDACEKVDEITLLCVPEAINFGDTDLHTAMLDQCAKLKDRFAILDVLTDVNNTVVEDSDHFRDNLVGANNLKYGAAYYPALNTSLEYAYQDADITVEDKRKLALFDGPLTAVIDGSNAGIKAKYTIGGLNTISDGESIDVNGETFTKDGSDNSGNNFVTVSDLTSDIGAYLGSDFVVTDDGTDVTIEAANAGSWANGLNITYNGIGDVTISLGKCLLSFNNFIDGDIIRINGQDFTFKNVGPSTNEFNNALTLAAEIETFFSTAVPALPFFAEEDSGKVSIRTQKLDASFDDLNITYIPAGGSTGTIALATEDIGADGINKSLYNSIKKALAKNKLTLYPCGSMAGVYARTDRNRGVWKAPANTSLNRVITPSRLITSEEQESLNIDATSGKSINAIRSFTGKGILVWGARTLAGNDNEWRYVPVRRLFIFMEESIQKATEFVVFEPNDANTWNRTKGMIENFLTGLWREGALAGAAPEDAFFVKVGLGETMTSTEVLEGVMNVEIGVAAVRPAEFIILKFSHKLQVS